MIFPVGLLAVFAAISNEAAPGASRKLAATAAQATKGLVARSLLGCRCHTLIVIVRKTAREAAHWRLNGGYYFCDARSTVASVDIFGGGGVTRTQSSHGYLFGEMFFATFSLNNGATVVQHLPQTGASTVGSFVR